MKREEAKAELLQMIPDRPCWVEARSLVLHSDFYPLYLDPARGAALLVSRNFRLGCLVGPVPADLERLVSEFPLGAELLVQCESGQMAAARLIGWNREEAVIHELVEPYPDPEHEVELLEGVEKLSRWSIPTRLHTELRESLSPVAVTFREGRPVSFCYAAAVTETWWDVSIETLPSFRRRGLAASCAGRMIHFMAGRDRKPVWGSLTRNEASWRLAARLGFRVTGRLIVFTRRHRRGGLGDGLDGALSC